MRIRVLSFFKPCSVIFLFFLITLTQLPVKAMVDNRFRDPALNHRAWVIHDDEAHDFVSIQPFIETAHNAVGRDQEKGLFDIYSPYYLYEIDVALQQTGQIEQSLIPTYWTGDLTVGYYKMNGRLQNQGFTFHWCHVWNNYVACGIRGEVIHSNSALVLNQDAGFDRVLLGTPPTADENQLIMVNNSIREALNINSFVWHEWAFGDMELYARFFSHASYAYKCRYIDVGATLGIIFPAAPARDINNPASIPLGGNRHWGIFAEVNLDAELRHDLRVGFWARGQKRLPRTDVLRMPHDKEPIIFGTIVGPMRVNPGWTLALAPYLIKEGLREGFGIRVAYTGVKHFKDDFSDRRCDKSTSINYCVLRDQSEWGQDYVTLGFIYDFAYGKKERSFEPVITFSVDVPVDFIMASRSFETYGISAGLEMSF